MAAPEPHPPRTPGLLLLGLFADFYQEVARIKAQAAAGTLPEHLAEGGRTPHSPEAQASAVSARLAALLLEQNRSMRQHGTDAQQRSHVIASYVMASLADELFIFELDWAGRGAWLGCLIEHRLFASRLAGRRFFEQAEQLLASPTRDALQRDLASCFLLALQLGFRGMHRGGAGAPQLEALRRRLWQYVGGSGAAHYGPQLFPQAWQHTVVSASDPRIAPIAPWLRWPRWWFYGYLAVSSLVWLWMTRPVLRLAGG